MSLHSTMRTAGQPSSSMVASDIAFGFGCTFFAWASSNHDRKSERGSAGNGSGRSWLIAGASDWSAFAMGDCMRRIDERRDVSSARVDLFVVIWQIHLGLLGAAARLARKVRAMQF